MKRRGMSVIAAVAVVAAAFASTAGAGSTTAAKTQAVSCKGTLKLAFMGPLTGDAGFIGTEQLQWFKYAVKTLPAKYGLKVVGVSGDTQLDNQIASSLAQKYIGDKSVMAVIGPSTSGAVAATSKTFFQAGMAHISGSATNTNLTKKDPVILATPAFFRVVPDDGIQGPADGRYMVDKLKVKKVVVIDSPGYLLGWSGGPGSEVSEVEEHLRLARVGVQGHERLLVGRNEGPGRRRHRLLRDAAAAQGSDAGAAVDRAGQEGEALQQRRVECPGQVQGSGLVPLQLRCADRPVPVQQADHRRLEEGQPEFEARLVRSSDLRSRFRSR